MTVHTVDIDGTFMEGSGGPFSRAPKVEREDYRMLAAIIEFKDADNKYFIKFYGPKNIVDHNEQKFKDMLGSLGDASEEKKDD